LIVVAATAGTREREPLLAAAHRVEEVELERRLESGPRMRGSRARRRGAAARKNDPADRRDRRTRTPRSLGAGPAPVPKRLPNASRAWRAFSASKPASSEIAPNSS
jgi:hypothetical protein